MKVKVGDVIQSKNGDKATVVKVNGNGREWMSLDVETIPDKRSFLITEAQWWLTKGGIKILEER